MSGTSIHESILTGSSDPIKTGQADMGDADIYTAVAGGRSYAIDTVDGCTACQVWKTCKER
ncbi:hypothetical protein [uncultured Methanomethylovorans sp.]|uniref:hypothetical protein n=1 Tax=uncultured Methanomethylovorans sp. TaxID=183759 RepID=UPI00261E0A4B|nr:hypothetical protein [uncultured Methanomethylovorans sp.]